jgi:hypothetical protein
MKLTTFVDYTSTFLKSENIVHVNEGEKLLETESTLILPSPCGRGANGHAD